MAARVDFTEVRLSSVLDGLVALADVPPVVSPSLNLVLYTASVPLEAPEDDPDAEPEFRELAMANDRRGTIYDKVGGYVCSDDGKLWAYVASDDVNWLVINHEKKVQLGAGRPFVNPEGTAVAYTQTVPDEVTGYPKTRVVVGDQMGSLFQAVEPAGFGARGVFAYKAYDGDQYGVIVGGEPSGPYGEVLELQWSPDGTRLGYFAGDPLKFERYVVVDGMKGPACAGVHGLRFSPDGRRVAYIENVKEGFRAVVDGRPGPAFPLYPRIWFSADGRTRLSRVGLGTGWAIAVNDRPGVEYEEVGPPVFNAEADTIAYAARRGERSFVVVGDAESEPCDFVYRVAVGEKAGVAFALLEGKNCLLVHNGREVRRDGPRPNHLAISPDGAAIAFSETHEGKVRIVADGEPGESFTSVDGLKFTPDGRTVVYTAKEGGAGYVVIGRRRYGPMIPFTEPVFNPAGDAAAVVAKIGREVWRKVLPLRP
jgi:hypothetical protein